MGRFCYQALQSTATQKQRGRGDFNLHDPLHRTIEVNNRLFIALVLTVLGILIARLHYVGTQQKKIWCVNCR